MSASLATMHQQPVHLTLPVKSCQSCQIPHATHCHVPFGRVHAFEVCSIIASSFAVTAPAEEKNGVRGALLPRKKCKKRIILETIKDVYSNYFRFGAMHLLDRQRISSDVRIIEYQFNDPFNSAAHVNVNTILYTMYINKCRIESMSISLTQSHTGRAPKRCGSVVRVVDQSVQSLARRQTNLLQCTKPIFTKNVCQSTPIRPLNWVWQKLLSPLGLDKMHNLLISHALQAYLHEPTTF